MFYHIQTLVSLFLFSSFTHKNDFINVKDEVDQNTTTCKTEKGSLFSQLISCAQLGRQKNRNLNFFLKNISRPSLSSKPLSCVTVIVNEIISFRQFKKF